MQLGLIGLGRMGGHMARRLIDAGHAVVAYDADPAHLEEARTIGAVVAGSPADLVKALPAPRAVWIMLPHGTPTVQTIETLTGLLSAGDLIIDGGNSHYLGSIAAAAQCSRRGIDFIDAGVSGGVWGLAEGYCIMAGGPPAAVSRLAPVLTALTQPGGFAHVGPVGAGHFVKMIHNAIEYGMLQALGEGFECLERSEFGIDLRKVAALWQHGSVVRSWLLELMDKAFAEDGARLEHIAPVLEDSGTGRWTIEYAVGRAIPIPAITDSVYARFSSRDIGGFSARVIAALRKQFGGHAVKRA
ncbi:MAG TPA: decarboxylating 6-phosphogluconate dehydrogenase [Candidatus Polarisedimenticolia bacterium]|jgi:6-phosphogluconate dehydrogenase|nr:decarboxylating 6-phosphogluconate dehydrogenase [Candidatus Polarisedimenticolia bacterium]